MTRAHRLLMLGLITALLAPGAAAANHVKIVKQDVHIDAVDPGIKLFVRSKMADGATSFTNDNVVLFVHGATAPSVCDFDMSYKDYSWADWMVERGFTVYLFDKRNYGYSARERAMEEPAAQNKPVSRSYLVIRDIGSVVDHIRAKHKVQKVTLIGWSWGAMTAGYYTSLHSEKVQKLVMYAPAYAWPLHTNLGPGSGLQNKRKPYEFNYGLGAYRLASTAANTGRWDGEIPVADKSQYRDPTVPEAFGVVVQSGLLTAWQATRRPGAASLSRGSCSEQMAMRSGQRGWKRHPEGGLRGLGTSPERTMRLLRKEGCRGRAAERRAWE